MNSKEHKIGRKIMGDLFAVWLVITGITASIHLMITIREATENSLITQQLRIKDIRVQSEKCSKKVANYVYVLDKKFYSEEGAKRIYNDCLNEL